MLSTIAFLVTGALVAQGFLLDSGHGGSSHFNYCTYIEQLIADWHKHGDDQAVRQVNHFLRTYSSNNHVDHDKNDRGKREYNLVHDKAYTNGDTVPDVKHVEDLIRYHTDTNCRRTITHFISANLSSPVSHNNHHPTAKPTTTAHKVTVATTKATTHRMTHRPTTTHKPITTRPTTTTSRPTTTTMKPTTPVVTTAAPSSPINVSYKCNGVSFLTALASGAMVENVDAGFCSDGTHSASEALVLSACGDVAPSSWIQGVNVMQNCDRIPRYTPVATFTFNSYVMDSTSLSGIFVECTPKGFKMAVQLCGHVPEMFELTVDALDNRQNANHYYVVDV